MIAHYTWTIIVSRNSNTRVIIAQTSVNEPTVNCEIALAADIILAHVHASRWYCVRQHTADCIKFISGCSLHAHACSAKSEMRER